MALRHGARIFPALWFTKEAEEAAAFYTSIFPDSRVDRVVTLPSETPSGPPGSVHIVDFTLMGQRFQAMDAGPLDPFNHAISFVIPCDTQAEIDRLWQALGEGGQLEECGWLRDKYGVAWQIVPTMLDDLLIADDTGRARRTTEAMLKMQKLDIAALQAAWDGDDANLDDDDGIAAASSIV